MSTGFKTLLDAALDYARRGWSVCPQHWVTEDKRCSCGDAACRTVAKHAIIVGGAKSASKDPVAIAGWWAMYPDANVAIAAGSRSGLIVLDIDAKNNGYNSLRSLTRMHGELPLTIEVHSGGGGKHYYFQAPRFEVRGRIGMLPGIDVRAEDQLFTAPPSRHLSGNRYEFDEKHHLDNNVAAPLPRWLLNRILTKNAPKKRVRRVLHW